MVLDGWLFILPAKEPTPLLLQLLLLLLPPPAPPDVTEGVSGPGLNLSGLAPLLCCCTAEVDEFCTANGLLADDGEVDGM